MKRIFLGLAGALLLAGCGEITSDVADQPPPQPALWQVASADGTVEGWLFGTIHALPGGTSWETELLTETIDDADLLILEIAALDDSAALSATFTRLSYTPNLPALSARLPDNERAGLAELMQKGGYSDGDFSTTESWAAALMLAQVLSGGDPENGVDKAILRRFSGRPIKELEGAPKQLGIFDALPESDQRDLLSAVVAGRTDGTAESARLARVWRAGDMEVLAQENTQGILRDPELRSALLVNRNQDWADQLARLYPVNPPAFVAVGAAHMAGPEGLPAILEQRGYTVTRIQ